jgi:glycosyltransferase involved in cell wall biosynthesis
MKVAIVHYWLLNMRGGEKVLEALLELFPEADIFTHVYDPSSVSAVINAHRVYTSSVGRLPFAKKLYQKYMPLMQDALKEFDLQDYDLVISSESGPAKGVVPNPAAFHMCYCHSPMRYLWDMYHEYMRDAGIATRFFMKSLVPGLRLRDAVSANLVDHFVANSSWVAKRIRRCYNREAEIVFPPVSAGAYTVRERKPEDFYLFFGQLAGYKRADLALEACVSSGRRLVVAGAGAKKKDIKKYEKTGLVRFAGRVSDDEAASLYSRAKALLFPGVEDFGIVPVEAAAAGCPVIAYRGGGALDTVKEGITGIFFNEQSAASLAGAMAGFESAEGSFRNREPFTAHARNFSREVFLGRIKSIVEERARI